MPSSANIGHWSLDIGHSAAPAPRSRPLPAPRFGDARDWWFRRRFGLFLHWGIYALNGWHEQEQARRRVPRDDYARLAARWNPSRFDPDEWVSLAERTGMSYLCLTTKHHDGFCLWDTRQTDFNVMNTPHGRDIVAQFAEACQRRGMPLCLYYSVADWKHPAYPNQGRHHELPPQPGDRPDIAAYIAFVREQITELCTRYGPIHGIWWDMNVGRDIDPSINALIRRLQPAAVINDRGFDPGDFGTPEREYDNVDGTAPFERRVEGCQSIGRESWGWRRDEDYYTDRHLMRGIDKFLARDGNYLLNVGPREDGSVPDEARALLGRLGDWYARVRESLEDAEPASHLTSNRDLLLTRRGNTLYVHLNKDPLASAVNLKPLALPPLSATLLNTGEPVEWVIDMPPTEHESRAACLRLRNLPVNTHANTVLVVKLEFAELPEPSAAAEDTTSDLMRR